MDAIKTPFTAASMYRARESRGVTGQAGADQHWSMISRQDSHAVPGTLARPDGLVAESAKGIHWKYLVGGLEFLEADHIRRSLGEPSQEIFQTLVDVVDIEGRNIHRWASIRAAHPAT
jgi:hypothetical protein